MIYKDNFAIIEGNLTLEASSSENAVNYISKKTEKVIDYPKGFNKENCVVISYGKTGTANQMRTYGWVNNHIDATEMLLGLDTFYVALYGEASNSFSNKIRIIIGNLSTSPKDIQYRIVLMKIK